MSAGPRPKSIVDASIVGASLEILAPRRTKSTAHGGPPGMDEDLLSLITASSFHALKDAMDDGRLAVPAEAVAAVPPHGVAWDPPRDGERLAFEIFCASALGKLPEGQKLNDLVENACYALDALEKACDGPPGGPALLRDERRTLERVAASLCFQMRSIAPAPAPFINYILRHPWAVSEERRRFYGVSSWESLYPLLSNHPDVPKSDGKGSGPWLQGITPVLLSVPMQPPFEEAIALVNDFAQDLQPKDIANRRHELSEALARQFRIMQWEIFARSETTTYKFVSAVANVRAAGVPSEETFNEFIKDGWNLSVNIYPACLTRSRDTLMPDVDIDALVEKAKASRAAFARLINDVGDIHGQAHQDLVDLFQADERTHQRALLVRDGELTFFLLLWHLRQRGEAEGYAILTDVDPERHVPKLDWAPLDEFLLAAGLAVKRGAHYVLTPRWRSLVWWLRLMTERTSKKKPLPLKPLPAGVADLREQLEAALSSSDLRSWVKGKELISESLTVAELSSQWGQFEDHLRKAGLLTRSTDEAWDLPLVRLSRTGFLPIEWLVRAYQPFVMQLLVLQLQRMTNVEPAEDGVEPRSIIHALSLGFASIVGALPREIESWGQLYEWASQEDLSPDGNELAKTDIDNFQNRKFVYWLAPYWALLYGIDAELTTSQLLLHAGLRTEGEKNRLEQLLWPARYGAWFSNLAQEEATRLILDESHVCHDPGFCDDRNCIITPPRGPCSTPCLLMDRQKQLLKNYLKSWLPVVPDAWFTDDEQFLRLFWELRYIVGASSLLSRPEDHKLARDARYGNRGPDPKVRNLTLAMIPLLFARAEKIAARQPRWLETWVWKPNMVRKLFLPDWLPAKESRDAVKQLTASVFNSILHSAGTRPVDFDFVTSDGRTVLRIALKIDSTRAAPRGKVPLIGALHRSGEGIGQVTTEIRTFVKMCGILDPENKEKTLPYFHVTTDWRPDGPWTVLEFGECR
jgi:hypothetical protein